MAKVCAWSDFTAARARDDKPMGHTGGDLAPSPRAGYMPYLLRCRFHDFACRAWRIPKLGVYHK